MRGPIVANHGVIPLLDVIENSTQPTLVLKLLTVLNMVIRNDFALQESLCLVGAIPVLTRYTAKRYGREIQLAAASFIQQICHTSSSTLQMFISCRGLRVLIEFLQGNYSTQKELVWIAINGIHSVFNLQVSGASLYSIEVSWYRVLTEILSELPEFDAKERLLQVAGQTRITGPALIDPVPHYP